MCCTGDKRSYVATFFSHYDAVAFAQMLKGRRIEAKPMPVPRRLSSSCGTCVRFEASCADIGAFAQEGLDKVYQCDANHYILTYENKP